MQELQADLWKVRADAKVITTNGFVKVNGEAVMGRGTALQAARRWPDVALTLGQAITSSGNRVAALGHYSFDPDREGHQGRAQKLPTTDTFELVAFPVKHNWWEKADLALIVKSVKELVQLTDYKGWKTVVMPRPGCGNGGRQWSEVRPLVSRLDSRFVIVNQRDGGS